MYRDINYLELGGTLYTPSISKNIIFIANGEKFPFLRSVVFCLEDAIKESDLPSAMENINLLLSQYKRTEIKVFLRPRDISNLSELLKLKDIHKIDGFALAKFSSSNMDNYFDLLNSINNKYHIMPVIESKDMFDIDKLKKIKEFLLKQNKHNILTIRIGGEDMFKSLGIKKECEDSIHDFHISSKIFGDILSVFKSSGFNVSSVVYNCLENEDIFTKEIQRDIKEGFFGKTVIHPKQAKIINELYKVTHDQFNEASQVLDVSKEAISRYKNKMLEPQAHNVWAYNIILRSRIYGLIL